MGEEEKHEDIPETGELTISISSLNIKQPREITKEDVDLALEAFERFTKLAKADRSDMHFR